jgi:hypothetical protein
MTPAETIIREPGRAAWKPGFTNSAGPICS